MPAELEPATIRVHDAGQIEPAGRSARIAAVTVARVGHADCFEITHAVIGGSERVAHQDLIGNSVIAGDDFPQDSVDIVFGKDDDFPGVRKCGVPGAANHPGINQGHPCAARAVALGAERGEQTAGTGADDKDVCLGEQTVKLSHE